MIRATKLQKKAAKVGFDWPDEAGVLAKIREELQELQAALDEENPIAVEDELGDLMFSVVNLVRFRKIDAEVLMANANRKFERRFGEMERILAIRALALEVATPCQMEQAWDAAKSLESQESLAK